MGLRDFSFFLSGTFVYELILIKVSMNANIVKTQIFHKLMASKVIQGQKRRPFYFNIHFSYVLFVLMIYLKRKMYRDNICLIQRRHWLRVL